MVAKVNISSQKKYKLDSQENEDKNLSEIQKFLKLPLKEQKRIISKQARQSTKYYKSDIELKEFRDADFGEK